MDNAIGGDPKNTVMKKSFQLLGVVLFGKRKKKHWWKGICEQITWTFPDFNHGIIPSFLSKVCLPKQT